MMKGTPCSRGNYAPLKTSSKTRILRSRGSAPGGVWGSAPTLLAAVNGSRAGYNSPAAPIPRSGFVLGSRAAVLMSFRDRLSALTECSCYDLIVAPAHFYRGMTSMDVPTPDNQPHTFSADDGGPLPRALVARLLKVLAAAMPADSEADRDENRQAAQEMFASLNPRDPAEAQLAAIAIAAAQSAMDGLIRAAQPGVSDEAAIRLRGSGLVAGWHLRRECRARCASARRSSQPPRASRRQQPRQRLSLSCRDRPPLHPRAATSSSRVTGSASRFSDLPDRADDAGAVACNPRVTAESRAGGHGGRRGGRDDRRAGSAWGERASDAGPGRSGCGCRLRRMGGVSAG